MSSAHSRGSFEKYKFPMDAWLTSKIKKCSRHFSSRYGIPSTIWRPGRGDTRKVLGLLLFRFIKQRWQSSRPNSSPSSRSLTIRVRRPQVYSSRTVSGFSLKEARSILTARSTPCFSYRSSRWDFVVNGKGK